ncbi:MAG: CCA tRNA nucleotidyltransferase [Phycisphaerales bacterium]|nr:CCA tRNA nucleotidyltransferase [Phycisphaerales bacterium]
MNRDDNQSQHSEYIAAVNVVQLLKTKGHIAYLAGGCVRDLLLGIDPKDFDVATDATPENIGQYFKRTASVGAAFGVMLVRDYGCTIEVATFRSDGVYSDTRRPDSVQFSSPIEDAQRRDFTINALFMDPLEDSNSPKIIDFVEGMIDVEKRVLRAVGDPEARLREDHLRALRGVRFAAKYGLAIEKRTFDSIRNHASELSGVSVERIGEEMRKMLIHSSRTESCKLIDQLDLDNAIFGDSKQFDPTVMKALPIEVEYSVVLVALAIGRGFIIGNDVGKICSHYRRVLDLSNNDRDSMKAILIGVGEFNQKWSGLSIAMKKRLLSLEHAVFSLEILKILNHEQAQVIFDERSSLEQSFGGLSPEPFVSGADLIELGLKPGPDFKFVLDSSYDAQLEGAVRTKLAAIAFASQLAKERAINEQ